LPGSDCPREIDIEEHEWTYTEVGRIILHRLFDILHGDTDMV
jgi:hypothetical protein